MSDHRLHALWRRRVLEVALAQLRQGITPQKIALTVALGAVLGLFPILGTTTALCVPPACCSNSTSPSCS